MLRVNPSLLDVAIFMTYPNIIENVSYIFPRGQYGLYCQKITREIKYAEC